MFNQLMESGYGTAEEVGVCFYISLFSSIVLLHLRVLFYCTIASASSLLLCYCICEFSSIVLLHLRVLFYCSIASVSSLLLYYSICEFSSIVLLHRPVLFHCTIAPLCSLVFSVCACTMHNCAHSYSTLFSTALFYNLDVLEPSLPVGTNNHYF